MGEKQKTKMD